MPSLLQSKDQWGQLLKYLSMFLSLYIGTISLSQLFLAIEVDCLGLMSHDIPGVTTSTQETKYFSYKPKPALSAKNLIERVNQSSPSTKV